MIQFVSRALRYNWDAHRANPMNLLAASAGMVINNLLFLVGSWMMLFAGKPRNETLLVYYFALNGMVSIAWGLVNFLTGGLLDLPDVIETGALESMLATPRNPLLLAALSRLHPAALGDILQGLGNFVFLAWLGNFGILARGLLATVLSTFAFAGTLIFAAAFSLFLDRGAGVSHFLVNAAISLSLYPTGKLFSGSGRLWLYLTPVAATAILPIEIVENASLAAFGAVALAAAIWFYGAVWFFGRGLRHFRTVNLIGLRA